jgi:chromosome segregation ATPase
MAETKRTILLEYEIETGKLLDANGKVIKSIKQLKEEVEAAAAANQKMGDVVGKNSEVVLGSITHIRSQISALKQQRDNTAVGSQEFQNLNVRLVEAQARLKAATTATIQHSNAQEGATQTTKELAKLQENQARSAGLAGAAAFELGRTISDLPFGLVAISNNISQLGTLFAALVANAGGLTKALKLLKAQLLGPAGILIAFQAVVAAVTFFSQRASRAAKETNDFGTRLGELNAEVANLEALASIVENGTVSLQSQQNALDALKKKGFDPATQSINEFIQAQQNLAIARATAESFAQQIAQLEKERIDLLIQARPILADLLRAQEEVGQGPVDILKAQRDQIKGNIDAIDEQITSYKERLKSLFRNDDLVDALFGGTDKEGEPKKKTERKVKEIVATYFGTTFQELEKRKKEADEILVALGIGTSKDQLGEIGKESSIEFLDAFGEGIDTYQPKDTGKFSFVKAFGLDKDELDAAINLAQTAFSSINDILMAQAEQEIAIETNKTNALNDLLRERLSNEQLSADERDKINQQIARNESELVKKENEINRRRFEQEKAANISMAIIDTFSAATSVLATTKKGAFERIAGMIAVTVAGLANVAAISKQEFVGRALPNPRLTGLGTAEQTGPTFNVVGASNQNQLAAAIQGITANPLKAYVVSSDVSSAQELDRRIVEGASI